MRVLALNASPHREGNTRLLLDVVGEALSAEGIAYQVEHIGHQSYRGCTACFACYERRDRRCALGGDDGMNEVIAAADAADAVVMGSPVYFADVTPALKAVIDRLGMTAKANGDMLRRKAGCGVLAVRRGGAVHAFDTINHFFFISQMIVPGSSYWNFGVGLRPGDVAQDQEGLRTMRDLGANLAWLLQRLHAPR